MTFYKQGLICNLYFIDSQIKGKIWGIKFCIEVLLIYIVGKFLCIWIVQFKLNLYIKILIIKTTSFKEKDCVCKVIPVPVLVPSQQIQWAIAS